MEHVFGLIRCGIIVFIFQSKDEAESVSSRNFSPDIPHLKLKPLIQIHAVLTVLTLSQLLAHPDPPPPDGR